MGHWRFQPRRSSDHLVVRTGAAGTCINGDSITAVENGRDLIQVWIAWANERTPRMNYIGGFLLRGGVGDICGYDQHRYTAFGQGCLTSRNCLAPGLLRGHDHVAKDAAALKDVIEIDLLNRLKPQILT